MITYHYNIVIVGSPYFMLQSCLLDFEFWLFLLFDCLVSIFFTVWRRWCTLYFTSRCVILCHRNMPLFQVGMIIQTLFSDYTVLVHTKCIGVLRYKYYNNQWKQELSKFKQLRLWRYQLIQIQCNYICKI